MSLDEKWMIEHHPQSLIGNRSCTAIVSHIRFLDADGNERTSMQKLVQAHIQEFKEAGQTLLEAEFPNPTYATGFKLLNQDGTQVASVDSAKVVRLTATVDIVKTRITRPLFRREAATYLFRNAIENDHRYVLVAEEGSELVAQVSLSIKWA